MKVIGITGGVGCGKSEVLKYLKENYNSHILMADNAAKDLQLPGGVLYEPMLQLLRESGARIGQESEEELLLENGAINPKEMAARIFADKTLLERVNNLVHPAVTKFIVDSIESEREKGEIDFFFLEAALLIENGFDKITDRMWYIYCDLEERKRRLSASRGYSDEKIQQIVLNQLSEREFREHCDLVIDNSGDIKETGKQLDNALSVLSAESKNEI